MSCKVVVEKIWIIEFGAELNGMFFSRESPITTEYYEYGTAFTSVQSSV